MPCYDVVIDINDPNKILVGTEYGVWTTDNGGSSWFMENTGMGLVPVFILKQQQNINWYNPNLQTGTLYAGTHGKGIFKSSDLVIPDLGIEDNSSPLKTQLNIYPNPTNGTSQLSFKLTQKTNVTIQVFDMNGKLMSSKRLNLNIGSHNVDMNFFDLASGTYFVSLNTGAVKKTKKFVKF